MASDCNCSILFNVQIISCTVYSAQHVFFLSYMGLISGVVYKITDDRFYKCGASGLTFAVK